MPANDSNLPATSGVKWQFPTVHPEGRKFALIAGVICLGFAFMAWETLARASCAAGGRSDHRPC
jgi:hypothetical protein